MEFVVLEEAKNKSKSDSKFTDRKFLIPQLLTCALFTFQALCGSDLIHYYNGIIFKDSALQPEHTALIYQTTITAAYLLSSVFIQTSNLDCRTINIIFLLLCGLSMMGLSLSFHYSVVSSLGLPCLMMAAASYGLGVGPVPVILMSTLFTQKNKSLGVAVAQTTRLLIVLIQMKVERKYISKDTQF